MQKKSHLPIDTNRRFSLKLTLSTFVLAMSVGSSPQLNAASFESEEFTLNVDSTITYGAQWRIEPRDSNISEASSGLAGDRNLDNLVTVIDNAFILNSNDGNNSFDNKAMTAHRLSMLTEMDMNVGNFGIFVRGKVWYDAIYDNNKTDMSDDNYHSFNGNPRFGDNAGNNAPIGKHVPDAKNYMKGDAKLLDTFVYGSFPIGDRTLDLRLGRQVISWGESMLSGGGLNMAMNHVDAQIRSMPGLEIKELFLPNGALLAQFDLTDTLTLQAFYQYEWQPSLMDPAGSYNSMFDGLGDGSGTFMFITGEEKNVFNKNVDYRVVDGRRVGCQFNEKTGLNETTHDDDGNLVPCILDYNQQNQAVIDLIPGSACITEEEDQCNILVMHEFDYPEPDDQGQFGFALNYVLDSGDELGLYFVNYHEKNPNFIIPLDVADELAPLINIFGMAAMADRRGTDYCNTVGPDDTPYAGNDPTTPKDNDCWDDEEYYANLLYAISPDSEQATADLNFLNLGVIDAEAGFVPENPIYTGPKDLGANLSTEQLVILLKFLGGVPKATGGGTISEILDGMGEIDMVRLPPVNLASPGSPNNPCRHCKAGVQGGIENLMLSMYGITLDTYVRSMDYRVKYFDNVRTWGMTYSTVLGVANVAAEITYRENAPIMRGNVARTPDRNEVWHMHLNTLMVFEPTFMWDFATLVAEAVVWHIPGRKNFNFMDMSNSERLAVQNTVNGTGVGVFFNMEWRSVWQGVDLGAFVFSNYGVDGAMVYTGYMNHQGTIALGTTAKFMESMEATVAVGANFGEKDDIFQTLSHDRDNISISYKYGF